MGNHLALVAVPSPGYSAGSLRRRSFEHCHLEGGVELGVQAPADGPLKHSGRRSRNRSALTQDQYAKLGDHLYANVLKPDHGWQHSRGRGLRCGCRGYDGEPAAAAIGRGRDLRETG